MKKIKTYQAVSTLSLVLAALFLCSSDNLGFAFMALLCLVNAWGFSELAEIDKSLIINEIWEGSGLD